MRRAALEEYSTRHHAGIATLLYYSGRLLKFKCLSCRGNPHTRAVGVGVFAMPREGRPGTR
nr:MAG TPA: hypothetical protein [Caudoviricetes sp.]